MEFGVLDSWFGVWGLGLNLLPCQLSDQGPGSRGSTSVTADGESAGGEMNFRGNELEVKCTLGEMFFRQNVLQGRCASGEMNFIGIVLRGYGLGLEFRGSLAYGLGFRIWGLGCGAWGLIFRPDYCPIKVGNPRHLNPSSLNPQIIST